MKESVKGLKFLRKDCTSLSKSYYKRIKYPEDGSWIEVPGMGSYISVPDHNNLFIGGVGKRIFEVECQGFLGYLYHTGPYKNVKRFRYVRLIKEVDIFTVIYNNPILFDKICWGDSYLSISELTNLFEYVCPFLEERIIWSVYDMSLDSSLEIRNKIYSIIIKEIHKRIKKNKDCEKYKKMLRDLGFLTVMTLESIPKKHKLELYPILKEIHDFIERK